MSHRNNTSGKTASLLGAVFGLFLITASIFMWTNRQYVTDLVANLQYQPPSAIASIATRTTMTDTGKFYFYASKPVLEGTQAFNDKCGRKESGSAILGCYTGTNIYLYDIKDQQLDGIEEVTAAHETLHAAYDRMSSAEKNELAPLLEAEYVKRKDDKELNERMAFYARTEAGERTNELHSIIGSEYGDLDPKLDAHYAKYFADRDAVLTLHDKYAAVFKQLRERADSLASELQALSTTIKDESAAYNAAVKTLNADIARFNQRASSGGFSSTALFQGERNALVARVNATDTQRDTIRTNIARYEQLREQYNSVADESNELYKSIDSNLAPAPAI